MSNVFLALAMGLFHMAASGVEGCHSATGPTTRLEDAGQGDPRMAVVSLRIAKTDAGGHTAALTGAVLVASTKDLGGKATAWQPGDFVCLLTDAGGAVLDTLVIPHPLEARYEYPSEDGRIGTVTGSLEENEVVVRFRYGERTSLLKVMLALEGGRLETVSEIALSDLGNH